MDLNTYLCYRCARSAGYSTNAETELLLESDYQLEKFLKHTRPPRIYHLNSLFSDPSTNVYRDYVVNAAAAGSVEIDSLDRVNFIWLAGSVVGATYQEGKFDYSDDAVKIVLPFDDDRIHAFPMSSTSITNVSCAKCGRLIAG